MPITRRGWFATTHKRPITRRGRGAVTRLSRMVGRVDGDGAPGKPEFAGDATRRTYLANERTYLAWWRTGVTSLAASIAVGRVVPSFTHQARWPYALLGIGFALVGMMAIASGFERQRQVRESVAKGEFPHASDRVLLVLTLSGVVLACGLLVLVTADF